MRWFSESVFNPCRRKKNCNYYSITVIFTNKIMFISGGYRANLNFRYFSFAANNIDSKFYFEQIVLAANGYVRGKVAIFWKIMTESPPGWRGQTHTGIAHLLFAKKYNMKIHALVERGGGAGVTRTCLDV